MNGKTVLITGITGFIGRHLAASIMGTYPECRIVGICRQPSTEYIYTIYSVNLLNLDDVTSIIHQVKPDYIFHLAGLVFSYDWNALYHGNVTSTFNLLEAIKKTQTSPHVVIVGSSAEYGAITAESLPVTESHLAMPQSPYGTTKLWQTMIAQQYQLPNAPITIARLFNIIGYGSSEKLTTGDIFSQIERVILKQQAPRIVVGNLQLKRDFLDIQDVCLGLIAIAKKGKHSNIYNLCLGASVSFQEILALAIVTSGIQVEIVVDKAKSQNTYVQDIYGCNARLKKDTNWSPTITLKRSVELVLSQLQNKKSVPKKYVAEQA